MTPIVVGLAAVEAIRRMGMRERRVVTDNISRIRREPSAAGTPSNDDLRPPNTWRHVCPGSTYAVDYRWSSESEEQRAVDGLVESLRTDVDVPTSPYPAAAGIVIVDIRSFYAF